MKFTRYPVVYHHSGTSQYFWTVVPNCPLNKTVWVKTGGTEKDVDNWTIYKYWIYDFTENCYNPYRLRLPLIRVERCCISRAPFGEVCGVRVRVTELI